MNPLQLTLACILAAGLSNAALAEIYESKDAQGNPVFTDTPTDVSQEVELTETNIADAVEEAPEAAPQAAPKAPAATPTQETGGKVIVVPDERNERLEEALDADMPHEVLDAEKRYEVGDDVTPEERARREAARTGEFVDKEGNTEIIRHRGHEGGGR